MGSFSLDPNSLANWKCWDFVSEDSAGKWDSSSNPSHLVARCDLRPSSTRSKDARELHALIELVVRNHNAVASSPSHARSRPQEYDAMPFEDCSRPKAQSFQLQRCSWLSFLYKHTDQGVHLLQLRTLQHHKPKCHKLFEQERRQRRLQNSSSQLVHACSPQQLILGGDKTRGSDPWVVQLGRCLPRQGASTGFQTCQCCEFRNHSG
mmetsp:Transcript_2124/g.3747  ORF Transcript_2124/g.3747 Transcript_2124/m.3747 type:complete len:207 (-) Transcript_2124:1163-1783(-)